MSRCDHNIIANSTFSLWGALLNPNTKRICVSPEKWLKNEDYKIFGKIISCLRKDYPPVVSRNFTDEVMRKVNLSSMHSFKQRSNNYLNVAASIIFAVVTSYTLVYFNSSNENLVSNELSQPEKIKDNLIQKVIDKDACKNNDKLESEDNACK